MFHSLPLSVDLLPAIKEALEEADAEARVEGAGGGADRVHAELGRMPASAALTPSAVLSIGPTVPPLRESLRIWNRCGVTPDSSHTRPSTAVATESVVRCPFESVQITIPTFSRGAWSSRYSDAKFGFTACCVVKFCGQLIITSLICKIQKFPGLIEYSLTVTSAETKKERA